MAIRTDHFVRCMQTLDRSLASLSGAPVDTIEYEVFRNAVVKGFELTFLESALRQKLGRADA